MHYELQCDDGPWCVWFWTSVECEVALGKTYGLYYRFLDRLCGYVAQLAAFFDFIVNRHIRLLYL
jgi:hypothetical protein